MADIKAGLGTNYNEDVLVIAGDTLFMEDFRLLEFVKQFHEFKKVSGKSIIHEFLKLFPHSKYYDGNFRKIFHQWL